MTEAGGALARYEAVIGIEVHSQLRTESKMFCACSTAYDGARPNTHVCPVCLGLPGALPTINRRAVEHVLATGAAIEATAPAATRWDRKNYFYPDLPKGYQISQYDLPLASRGRLTFDTSEGPFTVAITRAHLEEDTAKLVHATDAAGRKVSLLDFNRSGAPLMEIVTEPDIRTAEQARRYAEELQLLLRSIGASDADMERGQMRVEANVSLRPRGTEPFGTRVEVKNMNSFRAVERAIAFEIERQGALLDAGQALVQETRGWDDGRQATYRMRIKETSEDYRYFPEPDLPPLTVDPAWLATIRDSLPELPAVRRARFVETFGLPPKEAGVLVGTPEAALLFEATLAVAPDVEPRAVANWVLGEYMRLRSAGDATIVPAELGGLIRLVAGGTILGTNGKEVLAEHAATGRPVAEIVETRGFR
ncbi:MAG: Asp-tRNA(Asn)/Glu-tRNA(Gln) amidotransferase subunit GatB, partial [Chloroflexota bacterium]